VRPWRRLTRLCRGTTSCPTPAEQTTLAVTVEASAQEAWPWLVQMGHGRGGMYSYDWLENLIGLEIHSADGPRGVATPRRR